jgi:ABC-2 type transport system permease protein
MNYFMPIWALTVAFTKRLFRDKVGVFFTFLFPVIFLLVFGSINRGNGDVSFDIALINRSQTEFSRQFVDEFKKNESIKINDKITDFDDAKERLGRGEIDSILELPAEFGAVGQTQLPSGKAIVYYEEAAPQSGQTFAAVMNTVLDGVNQKIAPYQAPFTVEQKATEVSTLKPFDYVFSGLVGFSILSLSIFGMANGLPSDKKAGYVRRLRASPLTATQLLVATSLHYLFLGILSIVLMMVVGIWLFSFDMRGDWLNFGVFSMFGMLMMLGFGLAIGGWAKNEIQAAPLTQIVAMPMMFLSGSFFPRFLMPEWLQGIANYLPLTPIIDGMRLIMTEGKTLIDLGGQLGLMAVWLVVIYFIAIRVFRWE